MGSDSLGELREIIEQLHALRDIAYEQFEASTKAILEARITDIHSIKTVLDSLCDFCDEDRFLILYKKICRHIYFQYPDIVGEYANLYRAIWDTNDDEI